MCQWEIAVYTNLSAGWFKSSMGQKNGSAYCSASHPSRSKISCLLSVSRRPAGISDVVEGLICSILSSSILVNFQGSIWLVRTDIPPPP